MAGRPQKQTVDYFSHDADALHRSDTLRIIDGRYGNDGYALWFKLLERISSTDNLIFDARNSIKWEVFLSDTHLPEGKAVEILDHLARLGAIDSELWGIRVVWVQNLVNRVADVFLSRKGGMVPQRPIYLLDNSISSPINSISLPDNTQTKLKETKLKETKEEVEEEKASAAKGDLFNAHKKDARDSLDADSPVRQGARKRATEGKSVHDATTETEFLEYVEETRSQFPDLDCEVEFTKFVLWYEGKAKKISNAKLAWFNWLDKARRMAAQPNAIPGAMQKGGGNGAKRESNQGRTTENYRGNPSQRPAGAFADIP